MVVLRVYVVAATETWWSKNAQTYQAQPPESSALLLRGPGSLAQPVGHFLGFS